MMAKFGRRRCRGQSQVEYVVILALVSLVVILAGSLLGPAINRIFGLASGALGTHYNTVGNGHTIEILTAECIAAQSINKTGLIVTGTTDEPVDQLVASTTVAVGTAWNGEAAPVTSTGSENGMTSFQYGYVIAYTADLKNCPPVIVIQANDGAIAISPLTRMSE